MLLEMCPEIFDRIEFRCIGWQPFNDDPALGGGQILANLFRSVYGGTIPHDEQFDPPEVTMQCLEEPHHLLALDAAGVDVEVEAPQRHARYDRETFPVERFL